jgi:presenilin 1
MGFAAFVVLGYMGGGMVVLLVQALSVPIDCVTFGVMLFNF